MKYGFLVVEGPHDTEFVYRLLSPLDLKRIRMDTDLDKLFHVLIPKDYPPDGDLQKRMSTPLFLQNQTHCLAIHSAGGDTRLVSTIRDNFDFINPSLLTGVGLLIDADYSKKKTPAQRYEAMQAEMSAIGCPLAIKPGEISTLKSGLRVGAYVLPDNLNPGTVEDLLLECATIAYPGLLASAKNHLASATDPTLTQDDLAEFSKPSGPNKSVIGSIASILRPGKAIQNSIQDNRWLRDQNLQLPRIKAVQDFLKELFDL